MSDEPNPKKLKFTELTDEDLLSIDLTKVAKNDEHDKDQNESKESEKINNPPNSEENTTKNVESKDSENNEKLNSNFTSHISLQLQNY